MKITVEQDFVDYVALGDECTANILQSNSPLLHALYEFHQFFPRHLWSDDVDISPTQGFLAVNAYMLYGAAVRVALTGHAAATFPLFRVSLESACYAYLMGVHRSLEDVWARRHVDADSAKACRVRFGAAVKDAAAAIERSGNASPGTREWINSCYQNAIDFGAHPNPRSVLRHIEPPADAGDHWLTGLTAIHGADSNATKAMQMACLDYGLVLGVVLLHADPDPPQAASKELFRLNELKNSLESIYFS